MEMVRQEKVEHIHVCFMLAGHTKFAPDRLFAKVGSAYNCKTADVFTIHELHALCTPLALTVVEDEQNMLTRRDTLGAKYSDLPGVRKLHDFLVVKRYDGNVVMEVRDKCFTGAWRQSPLRLVDSSAPGNMVTMYEKFISPDRRPEYLPAYHPNTLQHQPASTSTSAQPARRKRKQGKCTVEGCDSSGHCNKARWNDGHTTRASCPWLDN